MDIFTSFLSGVANTAGKLVFQTFVDSHKTQMLQKDGIGTDPERLNEIVRECLNNYSKIPDVAKYSLQSWICLHVKNYPLAAIGGYRSAESVRAAYKERLSSDRPCWGLSRMETAGAILVSGYNAIGYSLYVYEPVLWFAIETTG